MKKLLPVFMLALIVIVSCKRDTQDTTPHQPEQTKYAVKIKVDDFLQEITDLRNSNPAAKADSLGGSVGWLYYIVYDSAGNWLHYAIQGAAGDPAFGQWTDSLSKGHYKMIVLGSKSFVEINGHYTVDAPLYQERIEKTYIFQHLGLSAEELQIVDFFSSTVALDINADSTAVNVTLDRKVGMVEVNLTDAPSDASFTISPTKECDFYYLYADTGTIDSRPFTIPFSKPYYATKVGPQKWQFLTSNTQVPFDIVLNAKVGLREDTISHYKIIHNVRAYKNKKTVLTGHFYDTTQHVVVGVNDQWDTATVNVPF